MGGKWDLNDFEIIRVARLAPTTLPHSDTADVLGFYHKDHLKGLQRAA